MKRKRLTCREKSVLRSAGKLLPHEVARMNREIQDELKEDYDRDETWDEICRDEGGR